MSSTPSRRPGSKPLKRNRSSADAPDAYPAVGKRPGAASSKGGGGGIPTPLILIGCTAAIIATIAITSKDSGAVATAPPVSTPAAAPATAPGYASNTGASSVPGAPPVSRPPGVAAPSVRSAVKFSTNVFGATVVAKSGDKELARETLTGTEQDGELKVSFVGEITLEASVGGETATLAGITSAEAGKEIALEFDSNQLKSIQKAATCLIRMPEGGFGSGFLMNDRQTITTAAHCVAADNVADLEFAFRPMEIDEITRTGAQLIFFDAGLDVAVLRLPEALDDDWPYMVHSSEPPKADLEIHAIGNPSRGGKPDPTFLRSGKIQGVGTDEFFLDVELKPGNSGGPVCEANSMVAHGIVSWKFLRKVNTELSYEEMGRSFAKITDLAGDAYDNFMSNDEEAQQRYIARLDESFGEQRAKMLAQQAALAMGFDSIMYWAICRDVSVNYIREINSVRARPYASVGQLRRAERLAHEEFMEEDGPKFAEKARTEVTPRLRMSDADHYSKAIASEHLSDELKDKLKQCYEDYEMIKAAAENVVQTKKSARELREERLNGGTRKKSPLDDVKSRNVFEFFEWTTDLTNGCLRKTETVLSETGYSVD